MSSFIQCVRLICILLILEFSKSNIIPPFGLRRGHDEPSGFFRIRTSDIQDNNNSEEESRDDMPTRKNPEFEKAIGELKNGKHNNSDPGIFSGQENKDVNYHMLVDEIFDSEKKDMGESKDEVKEAMVIPKIPNVQKVTQQPQEIISSETTVIQSMTTNPPVQQFVVNDPKTKITKGTMHDVGKIKTVMNNQGKPLQQLQEEGNEADYIQESPDDNKIIVIKPNLSQKNVSPINQSLNSNKQQSPILIFRTSTESITATTSIPMKANSDLLATQILENETAASAPLQNEVKKDEITDRPNHFTHTITTTTGPEIEEKMNETDLQNPIKISKIAFNKLRKEAESNPKSSVNHFSSQIKKDPSSFKTKDNVETNIISKSNDNIYDVDNQVSSFPTKLSDQYDEQLDIMDSLQKVNGTIADVKSINDDEEEGPLKKIFHILARENKLGGLKNRTNLINWKIVNHGKQTIIIL